jgi:predicted DNA-binding transcriptional regulator AlpA
MSFNLLAVYMPKRLPTLAEMIIDIGNPHPRAIAKALHVTERTVWRWIAAEEAPHSVMLAIFWTTRWGRSEVDTSAQNDAMRFASLARCLQDELDAIRARLARVAQIGDFGSSNDPAPEFSTNAAMQLQAGKLANGIASKPVQLQVKPNQPPAVEPSNHAGFQQKGYFLTAIRVRYAA